MNDVQTKIDVFKEAIVKSGVIKIAPSSETLFTLRSGKKSWIYTDYGDMLTEPITYKPLVEAMYAKLQETFPPATTVLVNIDSKVSPWLTGTLAYLGGYPQIAVNPLVTSEREKGVNKNVRLPKNLTTQDAFVYIDDILSKGGTLRDVYARVLIALETRFSKEEINKMHFHALPAVTRGQETIIQLAKEGIQVSYLLENLDILRAIFPTLSAEQQKGLKEEYPQL